MKTDHDQNETKQVSGEHVCRFWGAKRVSPAGGNRKNVSVQVKECRCGKFEARFPENLYFWDQRWIARHNRRIDSQNAELTHPEPK